MNSNVLIDAKLIAYPNRKEIRLEFGNIGFASTITEPYAKENVIDALKNMIGIMEADPNLK